jgi:MOSC domain-containing protein YiiM
VTAHAVEIVGFVVSSGHAYGGRPSGGPTAVETRTPSSITLRSGYGVVGDRYAGQPAHRDAAVTVLAVEALEAVADELGVPALDPVAARRTILLRGADVEALRGTGTRSGAEPDAGTGTRSGAEPDPGTGTRSGAEPDPGTQFSLDSGDGPVVLVGRRPAAPCAWMDIVLAPGAHAAMRGRAGVRCAVTGSGVLRVGAATLTTDVAFDPARAGLPRRGPVRRSGSAAGA